MSDSKPVLRYLGTDPAHDWLGGVPARDLTAADIAGLALDATALVASGLYAPVPAGKPGKE